MKSLGILGFSPGNGHPYSFSAIINGYDRQRMQEAGWPVIHDYLEAKDPIDFGVEGLQISHVWCPEIGEAKKVAAATSIPNVCTTPEEMIGKVDAVILARDDWESHLPLARVFLEHGLAVLIDKPLSLDVEQLSYFRKYLQSGKLMSCSGLRFATELDPYRVFCKHEAPRYISSVVVGEWEKYGIHMVDGIFSGVGLDVLQVASIQTQVRSTTITCANDLMINICCLGKGPKTFAISVFGERSREQYEIRDNFSAFKRLLGHFRDMLLTGKPAIEADHTIASMKLLIASNIALQQGRTVRLDEIVV